ncbi:tetratricopeptide repeat-containing sulfotransferase family protein [Tsuneonella suprasediminis]|uniref:tetratricopeptide repeat-containing sulfotransferase family protein n=1 Tax=Tsuneonella suprasediminis TaxID=2306996 RepID=UPI002F944878
MNKATITAPPQEILSAMQALRSDDPRTALSLAEAGISGAADRAPFLAIASLAALRLQEPDRAVPFLQELIERNPADHASRANLANALISVGREREALALVSGRQEPGMARIEGYLKQNAGATDEAIACYRRAVASNPNDLSSWNNLGNTLSETGNYDGAIEAFEQAITLAPADLAIYTNLAEALRKADRTEAHCKVLTDALKVAPDDIGILVDLGVAQAKLDDMPAAIATLRRAIELHPEFSDAHIELGMIYENLNRVDDLDALAASVDQDKAPPEAAFLFAWQARRADDFDKAAEFAAKIPESIHPMRRDHLVGGIADRRGDIDTAFAAFEAMNQAAVENNPPLTEDSFRSQVESELAEWTADWAAGRAAYQPGDGMRDPVFLVGFPRSGTTLLDTMLMGQPELSVLEERPMVAHTIKQMEGADLATLPAYRLDELRAIYFDSARHYGWDDTRWLVDKHPLNMQRVPTIHRLFPDARFILAERHPYDVVLSCFMANFTMNLAMRSFTSLEESALTYDAVFRAWERSIELFPVNHMAIRYERLVDDTGGELRPLVDWLGIEWNDRMLAHTETAKQRGRVRTASYSQIGEELYTRAKGRWVRYAAHLEPVMPILRPWAEKMGYPTS